MDVSGDIDTTIDAYYFAMQQVAKKMCLNGQFVCKDHYTKQDLDELQKQLNSNKLIQEAATQVVQEDTLYDDLFNSYKKNYPNLYGSQEALIDKFINVLKEVLGDNDLGIDTYPVYLDKDVFIVKKDYKGILLQQPYILTNDMHFRQDHPFFKTDVYYYVDRDIEIYYDTITLRFLGYKEKHKDYVLSDIHNNYLVINSSIKEKMELLGYETRYIDIKSMLAASEPLFTEKKEAYYYVIDNLIQDHIGKTKIIVDKFNYLISKIINYDPTKEETVDEPLLASLKIDTIIKKYYLLKIIDEKMFSMWFDNWDKIQNDFEPYPVDWTKSTLEPSQYVNSETINYYDIGSNLMYYALTNQLIKVLDSISSRSNKINLASMFVEIINYIYELYNIDSFKNILEIKRFDQILHGNYMTIDLLAKGQGLNQSKALEENLAEMQEEEIELTPEDKDELEDLEEEAEALDVEPDEDEEDEADYEAGADE